MIEIKYSNNSNIIRNGANNISVGMYICIHTYVRNIVHNTYIISILIIYEPNILIKSICKLKL